MNVIIEWCNGNQGFVSAILATASLLIAAIAIIISIATARRQRTDQLLIARRQEDLQKRQIKVDCYPYRLDCWKVLSYMKLFSEGIISLSSRINFQSRTPEQLIGIYESIMEHIPYSDSEMLSVLSLTKTSISRALWAQIEKIRELFDSTLAAFGILRVHDKNILSEDEMNDVKEENVKIILTSITELDSLLFSMMNALNADLYIGNVHKLND